MTLFTVEDEDILTNDIPKKRYHQVSYIRRTFVGN